TSWNTGPVKLTQARWTEMVRANNRANKSIIPVTDMDYYGTEEYWVMPKSHGDCEDFALMKRKELLSKGWPASSLLITVVRQPNGDGHAVLTVRTNRADYVLDNLNGEILQWDQTDYTYIKRQTPRHSGIWQSIKDTRSYVGAIK
ncbi:MAG: transglutaminase-like cysteine peptidase, partial [Salaquimonas sp.]